MRKENLDFLIMYEVTTRELEAIILLGNELKSRGYSVDYFSFEHCNLKKYLQNEKIIKRYYNKVDTVLMPSLYHDKEVYYLVNYVCGKAKHIVDLRWEQLFTVTKQDDYDCYNYPHGDAKLAYHLCWGKAIYENMINAGVDASKLLLSGPLHMDFLRDNLRDYYYSKQELFEKFNIPTDKKSVLYVSSFAIASRTERQIELEEQQAGQKLFGNAVEQQKKSRTETLKWIEELLKRDTCTFIYRPHPVENVLGDLLELENKYKNFRVISDCSVKQWILCCDTLTTWISTSIVEAFFANKSCLIVRPYPLPNENEMVLYKDVKSVDTLEKFLKGIDQDIEQAVEPKKILEFYDFGERASYLRLSDELEKIHADEANLFPWDDEKIKEFESHKFKYVIQSLLVCGYIPFINAMGWLREKTGFSFGTLNGRIDSYRKSLLTKHVRLASQETIKELTERIKLIM